MRLIGRVRDAASIDLIEVVMTSPWCIARIWQRLAAILVCLVLAATASSALAQDGGDGDGDEDPGDIPTSAFSGVAVDAEGVLTRHTARDASGR